MPNVFISSEIGSEWRTILGHPQLIECIGICVLSLAHVSELTDVYLHIVKKNYLETNRRLSAYREKNYLESNRHLSPYCEEKKIWKFLFKFSRDACPLMVFALIFFSRDFS